MKNALRLLLMLLALLTISIVVSADDNDNRTDDVYLTTKTEIEETIQTITIDWSSMDLVYKTTKSGWDSNNLEYENIVSEWVYTEDDGITPNNMITVESSSNIALNVSLDFTPVNGISMDGGFYINCDLNSDPSDSFTLDSAESGNAQSKSVYLMMKEAPSVEYTQKTKIGTVTITIESFTEESAGAGNDSVEPAPEVIPQIMVGNMDFVSMTKSTDGESEYYYDYTASGSNTKTSYIAFKINETQYAAIDYNNMITISPDIVANGNNLHDFVFEPNSTYRIALTKDSNGDYIVTYNPQ